MASYAISVLEQIDSQLEQALASWNIYTTLICIILSTYLIYPLFFYKEPDIHPLILARQSQASYVRHPGESAIFRSQETPQSYPLKSGLNVKDPGAPKWTSGRDGDLRDVWKRAVGGPLDKDGKPNGVAGKVLTVFGNDEVIENELSKLSDEVNTVGQHLKAHGGTRVAIYMGSSVEFLVTFFGKWMLDQSTGLLLTLKAAIFYGLTPILVPQSLPLEQLAAILKETKADVLVARAGVVPLNELLQRHPNLKQVVWVVERTSRHIDWNEVAEGEGGRAEVAVWHDVIDEKNRSPSELPQEIPGGAVPNVAVVSESKDHGKHDVVEFTQKVSLTISFLSKRY